MCREVRKPSSQVLPGEHRLEAFDGRSLSRTREHMAHDAGIRHQLLRILNQRLREDPNDPDLVVIDEEPIRLAGCLGERPRERGRSHHCTEMIETCRRSDFDVVLYSITFFLFFRHDEGICSRYFENYICKMLAI